MSQPSLLPPAPLRDAFAALRNDLLAEGGPRISTMRSYSYAILVYDPEQELETRREAQRLAGDLTARGWSVLSIDLQKLLLDRIRAQGEEWIERVIDMERRTSGIAPERGLRYLKDKIVPLVEGPGGIAVDCSRILAEHAARHPRQIDRTLALIGRAGGVHPFFRSSALLRHLDGQTSDIPVVLLYPGERRGPTGLSFLGLLDPDSDYRPRIYSRGDV